MSKTKAVLIWIHKLQNICFKGDKCPFAHSEDELREKPNLMRTKLCETFLESGTDITTFVTPFFKYYFLSLKTNAYRLSNHHLGMCKNGDRCTFAHGEVELRSTPDLFKTAICNLWNQGIYPAYILIWCFFLIKESVLLEISVDSLME